MSNNNSGIPSSLKLTNTNLIECGPNRIKARSVSWSCDGSYLAMASADRVARLWTVEASGASREVLVISSSGGQQQQQQQQQAATQVNKTRFHPSEPTTLCTEGSCSIRLWDVRNASQRATGKIDLASDAVSVEWYPSSQSNKSSKNASILAVTDRRGHILIYDVRKLPSALASNARGGRSSTISTNVTQPIYSFDMAPNIPESCVFTPQGNHLVAGTCCKQRDGVGEFRIFPWDKNNKPAYNKLASARYAAHCGAIYSLSFSPDGKRLASGGCDATVGLWDVSSMCCIQSIARHKNFIWGVSFSSDSKLLAVCSEDDGIDLVEAATGASVGIVNLGLRPRAGGAEEVAWHPKESYLLACARTSSSGQVSPIAPVTVAALKVHPVS